ncbi:hypothetical protein BU15DRAFT_74956 [Melanogaster broomeanus]|nr:hypothetical protein BU15DRAFT_74956 [Melanogaster broomeanus]
MPTLAEDDEHPELRNTAFNLSLDRVESRETTADSSTTNLIRGGSIVSTHEVWVRRTLMRATLSFLAHTERAISVIKWLIRGEKHRRMTVAMSTISLNDLEPYNLMQPSSNLVGAVPTAGNSAPNEEVRSDRRSRFRFPPKPLQLQHHFLLPHTTSAAYTLDLPFHPFQERIFSLHGNSPSHSHSHSNSSLFRAFRGHSPSNSGGLPVSSPSTISLDNISAPLTHTLTRSEFRAPKGGLLTADQIKLITSREALERFGMPYGPDAVAAFSLSRERLGEMGPPPDFESITSVVKGRKMRWALRASGAAVPLERSFGDCCIDTRRTECFKFGSRPFFLVTNCIKPGFTTCHPDFSFTSALPTLESDAYTSDADIDPPRANQYASDNDSDADDEPSTPLTALPRTPVTARPLSMAGRPVVR